MFKWCERGDSNSHALRHQILSLARLPIPPRSLQAVDLYKTTLHLSNVALNFLDERRFLCEIFYMRLLLSFLLLLFLASCVNLKPYSVGSDIDASWHLRYQKSLDKEFLKLAEQLCPFVKNSKVAILDFVNENSNVVDEDGRYAAYLLSEDLDKYCPTTSYYLRLPSWFDYKHLVVKSYPSDKYEFLVLGSFKYENGCYDIFVRLIDLKEGLVFRTFSLGVYGKKRRFSIEPLNIPNYVEFP